MRVVLDSVIIVRALIDPRSLCGRLIFDYRRAYDLVVSTQLAAEYRDVLGRPEIVRKFRAAGTRNLNAVMQMIDLAPIIPSVPDITVSRDPGDDKVLAVALAGNADYIVSEDRDLLDLASYEGIAILTARAFIEMLQREAS